MVHPAAEFYIGLSLIIIFCTVVCFVECGKCPREGVSRSLYSDVFGSLEGSYNGLPNSYSSYFSLDYASEHQKMMSQDDNACRRSNTFLFPSTLYGLQSEAQCVRPKNLDINKSGLRYVLPEKTITSDGNVSWSLDDVVFRLHDGGAIKCSLNVREFGREDLPASVNGAEQIVDSSCRGHIRSKKETFFSLRNMDIRNSPFSDPSSPCVNISPSKLKWGQSHMYHSSLASLRLKNTCSESVLTVYELFSTDSQFYPFNFSEVVLGPGQVTTVTFAFLPNRLGFSSAELVLLTSLGGFLIETNGFSVESPHKLRPLVAFDAPGGWLSGKLSLSNLFDEIIDLEEVTGLLSVFRGSGSLLVESICRKQNIKDSNTRRFSNGDFHQIKPMVFAVRPLSSWSLSPHNTQRIMEMAFLPDSKVKVVGAFCMKFLRPMEGEKDTLMVPFEAELNKTDSWKDVTSPLSVSVEAVGPCGANDITISISVHNHASHMLKIVNINEIVDSNKLFQIQYLEGLLLFPDTSTQVALVTYKSSKFVYDSFLEIPDLVINCKVEIQVNDTLSPLLEVPCLEIFGICSLQQQKSLSHIIGIDDPSNQARSMPKVEKSPILSQMKALVGAEVDEIVLDGLKAQGTLNGPFLLNNHEIVFPPVLVGEYYARSITVSNPSDQPIIVQLILNSGETIGNCKNCGEQHSPSPSSACNDSVRVSGSGFSISDTSVTEAFLYPHSTGSLGPILFHPTSRCEWRNSAFLRSNFSGLELLLLRGFGAALSLVMLEGSDPIHRLDFHMNLPFSHNASDIKKVSSSCSKPLLKKLFAVNAGDFPVVVDRIDVSGKKCGLDGFLVHNCRGFSLLPGESMELGLSYQSDFSMPLVKRELELILAVGILVIPLQASLPLDVLSLCAQSIFWSDIKRYSWAMVLTVVLFSLVWYTVLYQGTGKAIKIKSIKTGHMKQGIITGRTVRSLYSEMEINPSNGVKGVTVSSSFPFKSISIGNAGKHEIAAQPVGLTVKTSRVKRRRSRKKNTLIEVSSSQSGNSTPTSPLSPHSPVTTLSPPETRSPSSEKNEPHDSFSPEPLPAERRIPENPNQDPFGGSRKSGNRAVFTPSATFPGLSRNSPSRLAIGSHARAPGRNIHSQNAVQPKENPRAEDDMFTYNIWGNHLTGVHLYKPNSSLTIPSGTMGHSSNSFFLRCPQQTLMTDSQTPSVCKFCDDDG